LRNCNQEQQQTQALDLKVSDKIGMNLMSNYTRFKGRIDDKKFIKWGGVR